MSETVLEPVVIEGIDFDTDIPCDTENHDHPAEVRLRIRCPHCGSTLSFNVCRRIWHGLMAEEHLECDIPPVQCGLFSLPEDVVTVVGELR